MATSTKNILELHQARVHTHCKQCDKTFQTNSEILDHLKDVHEIDYQCNICFTRCFSIETLRNHINSHNSQSNTHKCNICDYTTTTKSRLEQHENLNHIGNTAQFQCNLCDWKTIYESTLRTHMTRMHSTREATFHCDIKKCNYSTTEVMHLKAHKKSIKHQENLRKIQLTNQNGQWLVPLKRFRS